MLSTDLLKQDYFALFSLSQEFQIDVDNLKQQYQHLQSSFHPDKFANKSSTEQSLAMQISTHINTAYQTLSHSLARAIYLLSLQGIDAASETDTQLPMEFLMQQMEVREAISEAASDESGLTTLEQLANENNQAAKTTNENFISYYQANNFDKAKESVRVWQFQNKIQEDIKTKIASIEDALLG